MSTKDEVAAKLEAGLRLAITNDDINCAVAANQYNCAIVRSIQRQFPDAVRVRVNSQKIAFSLDDEDVRFIFDTPETAVERVIRPLDEGRVRPEPTAIVIKGGRMRPIEHDRTRARQTRDHEREIALSQKAVRPSVQLNKQRLTNSRSDYQRFAPDA